MADDTRSGSTSGAPGPLFPTDLLLTLVLTALSLGVVFLPGLRETAVRFVFGLLLIVFLPGYAAVAALFPERRTGSGDPPDVRSDGRALERTERSPAPNRHPDGLERAVLSVGLSLVLVVLSGLLLNYTGFGIRLVPLAAVLTAVVVPATLVAGIRRRRLPDRDRFYVPFGAWLGDAYREFTEPDSSVDAALNVVIVVAILITVSSLTYAAAGPHEGEQYTELYLVTENESDFVAADYPQQLASGENQSLVVGLGNHEGGMAEYSLVVELQDVDVGDGETTIEDRQEVGRLTTTLANNETVHYDLEVTPETTGENRRLAVMLYRGEVPDEPKLEGAYRSVHLWVDVVAEAADEEGGENASGATFGAKGELSGSETNTRDESRETASGNRVLVRSIGTGVSTEITPYSDEVLET